MSSPNLDESLRLLSEDSSLVLAGMEAYCGREIRISGDTVVYECCGVEGSMADGCQQRCDSG
jgi:hypothetical protein